jgi:hypothetical protein
MSAWSKMLDVVAPYEDVQQTMKPGAMQWNSEHQRAMVWTGDRWVWAERTVGTTWPVVTPPTVQQGPTSSVHYEKQPMAHTMHLILTILTCGLWGLFVWLPLGLVHSMSRGRKVTTKYR